MAGNKKARYYPAHGNNMNPLSFFVIDETPSCRYI